MNKIIIFIFLLFALLYKTPIVAQTTITYDEVLQTGLCLIDITTENNEEPQGTIIESPLNPGTYNMTYANKVPCRIIIKKDNNTLYDSGDYIKSTSGATIRINGNTTAYYSDPLNMPYKLKLEKAADLLCRENDNIYADKHWRLLKDAVSMNTMIGLKVSQLIGLEWTSSYIPCNVIINGDYRGCYLLMETVSRNNNCRIYCNKKTGTIIERDPYWWKEDTYFSSNWYKDESMYRWTWKYPDVEDLTENQKLYIQQYINDLEQSIVDGNYCDYIDLSSWSKWLLAHDLLGTRDSGGANMYFKKTDNTNDSKIEMPCIWDFDSNFDVSPGSFSRLHTSTNAYFNKIINSENKKFAEAYVNLWNNIKEGFIDNIKSFINDYPSSEEAVALNNSRLLHNKRWNTTYNTVNDNAQYALQWFNQHIDTLDANIQNINISTSINNNHLNNNYYQLDIYNLNGQKILNKKKLNKGIYIYNRNKIIIK